MHPHEFYPFRRLLAFVYDALIVVAILLLAGLVWVLAGVTPEHAYYPVQKFSYLLLISFYFVWFWTHGGQTLGMRAWRLRLVSDDGGWGVSFGCAWLRLALAMPSLLFIALLVARLTGAERTWYDKLSCCRVIATDA